MGQYQIYSVTVSNRYKEELGNQKNDVQAFQFVAVGGKVVLPTLSISPKGWSHPNDEEPGISETRHQVLRKLVDFDKYKKIRSVGTGFPTQLKDLGWDGDDLVFWRIFWQKCINEGVLKLKDFKTYAQEMYKLEGESDVELTFADKVKNPMKAMKDKGKNKVEKQPIVQTSLADELKNAEEAMKSEGKKSVTASGATGGTASTGSEERVSRRGTNSKPDPGVRSSRRSQHSRSRTRKEDNKDSK